MRGGRRDFMVRANRANMSVYPVTPDGTAVRRRRSAIPGKRSGTLIVSSGESAIVSRGCARSRKTPTAWRSWSTNDLSGGMKRKIDDVSAYYLLGYYSTNTRNEGGIEGSRSGSSHRTSFDEGRRGYFAPIEASASSRTSRPPSGAATAAPTRASRRRSARCRGCRPRRRSSSMASRPMRRSAARRRDCGPRSSLDERDGAMGADVEGDGWSQARRAGPAAGGRGKARLERAELSVLNSGGNHSTRGRVGARLARSRLRVQRHWGECP